jgi:hypothetical protein
LLALCEQQFAALPMSPALTIAQHAPASFVVLEQQSDACAGFAPYAAQVLADDDECALALEDVAPEELAVDELVDPELELAPPPEPMQKPLSVQTGILWPPQVSVAHEQSRVPPPGVHSGQSLFEVHVPAPPISAHPLAETQKPSGRSGSPATMQQVAPSVPLGTQSAG